MYRFKGFAAITSLVSNVAGVVAPIGELSQRSLTFSKTITQYVSAAANSQTVSVIGFSSKTNGTTAVAVPSTVSALCTEIAEWVHNRQRVLAVAEVKADFVSAFTAAFSTKISNLSVGDMVVATNSKEYPTYIRFKATQYTTDDNLNTLWFSDASFEIEYDDYEIDIVPPLSSLETFFSNYPAVVSALADVTYNKKLEALQQARSTYAETTVTSEDYLFYNANDTSASTTTSWTFLIYGPKGNDPDAIKQALITYLNNNSTRGLAAWRVIFPDIFKSTEFLIIPKWNQYSIEEMTLQSGIYSPMINLRAEIDYVVANIVENYTATHIESNLTVMGHPYKSLALLVLGGPDNRTDKKTLTSVFDDIIMVTSTSNDFSRMKPTTMTFLNHLAQMLVVAETMDASTDIPSAYKTATRDGITYLTLNYGGINYFVSSKKTTP